MPARPSTWRVWLAGARPRALPLAATPVMAGTALAWSHGASRDWPVALAALGASIAIQVGTNLHNDAADFERGADRPGRIGPLRITAAGWARPAAVRRAARVAFAVALALGLGLAAVGGWPILAIGAAALATGWAYSRGPLPISYTPFGEAFVFLFFGVLAVAGSAWLQSRAADVLAAAALGGAMLGCPAAAVLLVNNLRDRADDEAAGRHTLASMLGDAGARRLFAALLLAPFALLPPLVATGAAPGSWLAGLALPPTLALVRRMWASRGAGLNAVLAATAQCHCGFGLLLAAGQFV